jgi:hypothetical protein
MSWPAFFGLAVGDGVLRPNSTYAHIVALIEIIFGLLSMSVITGLVFVRFSKPRTTRAASGSSMSSSTARTGCRPARSSST